ncbi:hypothetical protein N7495_008873 [Penicillium taxi]|uniref:uncharacterized protein n=1 Tax=Penicillium taxi TaxID=168475 RepID=UPI002544E9DB|nr:uncharacterized protein N7495_008873 [Penicillium taxi]KAJ5888832.1 hypothetical protein N7495_008873 [Penicillium taxi]
METNTLSDRLIQTTRDGLLQITWVTFLAVLIISCITTRVITAIQSRETGRDKLQRARLAPYWFPWIGHGFSLLWNQVSFFESLRETMRESVFYICLRGQTLTTVVSPSMTETIMSSQGASSAPLLDQALKNAFGDSGLMRNLLANRNQEITDDVPEIMNRESFASDVSSGITRLLQRNLPNFVTFCRSPVDQTYWERESQMEVSEEDQKVGQVYLFSLVREFVGQNISTLLMGETFVEAFPGILGDLWKFDNGFAFLFAGFPRWMPSPAVSAGYPARERLLHVMSIFYRAFTAWDDGIDPGIELRDLDDVSELVKERMRTFRKLEMSPFASAAGNLSFYWDVIEHSTKLTFWTLIHIITDRELLKEIRKEISPFVKSSRPARQAGFPFEEPLKLSLDVEELLQSCTLLKACYYEATRLHCAGISFRKLGSDLKVTESVTDAAQPRTYKFLKGEKVIMPHGVHYNDAQTFSNPDQFDPLRFIVMDAGTKQANPAPLGSFADGLYGSKHNKLTERIIIAFTASIVSMWDISSTDDQGFAVPENKTTWGAFQPVSDLRVKIKSAV